EVAGAVGHDQQPGDRVHFEHDIGACGGGGDQHLRPRLGRRAARRGRPHLYEDVGPGERVRGVGGVGGVSGVAGDDRAAPGLGDAAVGVGPLGGVDDAVVEVVGQGVEEGHQATAFRSADGRRPVRARLSRLLASQSCICICEPMTPSLCTTSVTCRSPVDADADPVRAPVVVTRPELMACRSGRFWAVARALMMYSRFEARIGTRSAVPDPGPRTRPPDAYLPYCLYWPKLPQSPKLRP